MLAGLQLSLLGPTAGRRGPLRWIGALAALLVAVWQPVEAAAQDAVLPAESGAFKGAIRRGADGRLQIAPDQRPRTSVPEAAGGPLLPPGSSASVAQAVSWAHAAVGRIAGYDHGRQAKILQRDIDALVARERRRKSLGAGVNGRGLTAAELHLAEQLRQQDQEVRRHEARHYETGRPYTQAPRFWFVTGPGGRRYAVSGQVTFVLEKLSGEPHELLHQLTVLRNAALAPREPSEQDLAVARALGETIQGLRTRAVLRP